MKQKIIGAVAAVLVILFVVDQVQSAQQVITPGAAITLPAGRDIINHNFTELYQAMQANTAATAVKLGTGAALVTKSGNTLTTLSISTTAGNVTINNGTIFVNPTTVGNGDKGDITVSGGGDSWAIDAGAVSMAKIAQSGATTGQVIKWTGSAWAPTAETGGSQTPWSTNINAANFSVTNLGSLTQTSTAVNVLSGTTFTGNTPVLVQFTQAPGGFSIWNQEATASERTYSRVYFGASPVLAYHSALTIFGGTGRIHSEYLYGDSAVRRIYVSNGSVEFAGLYELAGEYLSLPTNGDLFFNGTGGLNSNDDTVPVKKPLELKAYSTGSLPAANLGAGMLVHNTTVANLYYSDGTTWKSIPTSTSSINVVAGDAYFTTNTIATTITGTGFENLLQTIGQPSYVIGEQVGGVTVSAGGSEIQPNSSGLYRVSGYVWCNNLEAGDEWEACLAVNSSTIAKSVVKMGATAQAVNAVANMEALVRMNSTQAAGIMIRNPDGGFSIDIYPKKSWLQVQRVGD